MTSTGFLDPDPENSEWVIEGLPRILGGSLGFGEWGKPTNQGIGKDVPLPTDPVMGNPVI